MSDQITIRTATIDDAKLLTDLSFTTFWDAFAHHPKNAPDDLNHYMRQAFSAEQIAADFRTIYTQVEELVKGSAEQETKAVGFGQVGQR